MHANFLYFLQFFNSLIEILAIDRSHRYPNKISGAISPTVYVCLMLKYVVYMQE